MSRPGIEFQLVWYDQHVLEYRFTCSNGKFCGEANAYLGYDDFSKLLQALKGFPSRSGDHRQFELGTFDPKFAGGGIRLRFSTLDSAGHSTVDIELRADSGRSPGYLQSVTMRIPVEAAGIDDFISEAEAIGLNIGSKASLPMH